MYFHTIFTQACRKNKVCIFNGDLSLYMVPSVVQYLVQLRDCLRSGNGRKQTQGQVLCSFSPKGKSENEWASSVWSCLLSMGFFVIHKIERTLEYMFIWMAVTAGHQVLVTIGYHRCIREIFSNPSTLTTMVSEVYSN